MPSQDKNGSPLKDWDKGFLPQNTQHLTDALGTVGLFEFSFMLGGKVDSFSYTRMGVNKFV